MEQQPESAAAPVMPAAFNPVLPTVSARSAAEPDEGPEAQRTLAGTELQVYPVALFGSTFGWSVHSEAAEGILDAYRDGGGNFLQTADHHSGGNSERMIGRWLRTRSARDEFVISSTIGRSVLYDGTASSLINSAEATLSRLGTDRIDLLNLYGFHGHADLHELLAAAERLLQQGKIRAVMANDFTPEQLLQARIIGGLLHAPLLSAVQASYNLIAREHFERELAPIAAVQGLSIMPKHALANGYLTGAYRVREHAERSQRGMIAIRHQDRRGMRILDVLVDLAQEHGQEPATIALAWALSRPGVVAPVVSAGSPRHIAALLAAPRIRLTAQQLSRLEDVSG